MRTVTSRRAPAIGRSQKSKRKNRPRVRSINHLVRGREVSLGRGQTQRLGRLEIGGQSILVRRLHRQVTGLRTLEDAIDVNGCASVFIGQFDVGAVGCRQLPELTRRYLHAERCCSYLDRLREEFRLWRRVGIEHDGDPRKVGSSFLEQIEPFAADREFVSAETGDIAARLPHARNETLCNRIGDRHEHNWHGACGLSDRGQVGRGGDQDQVRRCWPHLGRKGPLVNRKGTTTLLHRERVLS